MNSISLADLMPTGGSSINSAVLDQLAHPVLVHGSFHSDTPRYLMPSLDPMERNYKLREVRRKGIPECDAFVVTGISGIAFGAVMAHEFNKQLVVVRRLGEAAHSKNTVEGLHGEFTWIMLDDFVSNGTTFKYVETMMSKHRPAARCQGLYLYYELPADRDCIPSGVPVSGCSSAERGMPF